jgi:translation initiation factor 4A
MAVSVQICTMSGALISGAPVSFPGPTVKVVELQAIVQEARPNQIFDLLLGERILNDDAEELTGPDLLITVAFDMDYASMAIDKFQELDLKADLLRGMCSYGFEGPSELQKRAIRPLIESRDVIVQSASGTGKTASYVIGGLQRIDSASSSTQVIVLVPTRELACAIQKVALSMGRFLQVTSHACIVNDFNDRHTSHAQFVVGTPCRVYNVISQRHLSLDALKLFVLDDADEMISRGFKDLIFGTLELLEAHVQKAVFCHTMPPKVSDALRKFMHKPVRLTSIKKNDLKLGAVRQFYIAVENEDQKIESLVDLLKKLRPLTRLVIYCNTRRKVDFVANALGKCNYGVSIMHSELLQKDRDLVIDKFVLGSSGILVSTDLSVRSNNFLQSFPKVVNYDLPPSVDYYLHRVGRPGSLHESYCHESCLAINFVTDSDVRSMRSIANYYHTEIEELPLNIGDVM